MKKMTSDLLGEVFENPIMHLIVLGGLLAWFVL
jgi:hypothetical protein